jgi:hypothetical protein
MEADWEFEVGRDAPMMEACWTGFVDLRAAPDRVGEIGETRGLPGLANALVRLNAEGSSFWTSKCDVFQPEEIDADEVDAQADETDHRAACYIDLLLRSDQVWNLPLEAEHDCKQLCTRLRRIPLRCCRVDLVIRRAVVGDWNGLGATAYFTACGRTELEASERLAECLAAFAETAASVPESSGESGAGARK